MTSPKPPTRNNSTESNEPPTMILDKSAEEKAGTEEEERESEVEMSQTAPNRTLQATTAESAIDVHRKFVLMVSSLDSKQRADVNLYAGKVGCSVKNTMDASVTHVVIKHDDGMRCERTLKYFQAVAAGKLIVGFKWIAECKETRRLLDPKVRSRTSIEIE